MKKKNSLTLQQRAAKVKKRLLHAASRTPDILLLQYDTSYLGFEEEQVEDMWEQFGKTKSATPKRTPL